MLAAAQPAGGRISQLLPSVKCSTCGDPVPLDELGDHVCQPPPAQPPPPAPLQPSKSSLLTQRINNIVSRQRSPSPNPQRASAASAASTDTRSSYSTLRSRSRSRSPSARSSTSTFRPRNSDRDTRTTFRGEDRVIEPARSISPARSIPTVPPPRPPSAASVRSQAHRAPSATSIRSRIENAAAHNRTPSPASFNSRLDSLSNPSSSPRDNHPPPAPAPVPASYRERAPSNVNLPRDRTPSNVSAHSRSSSRSVNPRPGPAPINLPSRRPSAATSIPSASPPLQPPHPPPSPGHQYNDERDIDTKTGGEAGMAGVGRRGFAAAARAAMFASSTGGFPRSPTQGYFQDDPSSIGARRGNPPPWLEIGRNDSLPTLPPIATSHSPLTLSPHSPHSPHHAYAHSPRSPLSPSYTATTATLTNPSATSPTSTLNNTPPDSAATIRLPPSLSNPIVPGSPVSSIPFPLKPGAPPYHSGPKTPTDAPTPLFNHKQQADDEESIDAMAVRLSLELEGLTGTRGRSSPAPSDSDSDAGGLAYADSPRSSVISQDGPTHRRTPSSLSTSSSRGYPRSAPSLAKSQPTTPARRTPDPIPAVPRLPPLYPRTSAGGGIDNAMEALLRSPTSVSERSDDLSFARHGRSDSRSEYTRSDSRLGQLRSDNGGHARSASRVSQALSEGGGARAGAHSRTVSGTGSDYDYGSRSRTPRENSPLAWGKVKGQAAAEQERKKLERARESAALDATAAMGALKLKPSKSGGASAMREVVERRKVEEDGKTTGRATSERRPRLDSERRQPKVCVNCRVTIEDGRWVRVENGKGVLCESCWKGMYLPKCRRCSKPIEKQAVSSSDGQLKGKYHRECFNCHTCNKPFPDKSFYVFDGKPFCEYHYHEMNDSLCAAPSCGLPIEGPCAVSHAGARYHPAHLTCEHISFSSAAASSEDDDSDSDNEMRRRIGKHGRKPSRAGGRERGKRCTARLEEYWEVDGKMLCERHMKKEMEHHARDERALRRVTRFIDLSELR